ncbi:MAG: hypothetical protein OQK76_07040 [Gammaproteobacteria bacterium]|nr:hypothetical protein [Gammaproteobacteria bacterium]MCW8910362.1 hypothetical protein [Gammaproteobacteria bacterium]MCW9006128.1 hypothetical protein [Gammaproteobacteria bacterium]MCW9055324.1 hypothetical protein [Gammaproteobacteria bacterium]
MKYLYLIILLLLQTSVNAESKRIEVYASSQSYWDVQAGDTLSIIVQHIIAKPSSARQKLMNEILSLNPDAFINANPDRLKAGTRLWLPNGTDDIRKLYSNNRYQIKNYSWGQVIQRK